MTNCWSTTNNKLWGGSCHHFLKNIQKASIHHNHLANHQTRGHDATEAHFS